MGGNRTRSALLIGCSLVMVACGSTVYSVRQEPGLVATELRHAMAGKDVATVIRGNPFGTPEAVLRERILRSMAEANASSRTALVRPTRFVPAAEPADYWASVMLNPPADLQAASLCELADVDEDGRSQELEVRMVLCRDRAPLLTSRGYVPVVTGPDDPRFRRVIRRLTVELLDQVWTRDDEGDSIFQRGL